VYVYLWNVYIRSRIEPSNAFRVVFKVAKYTANVEYGDVVEMAEQEHELWLDKSTWYSLAQFYDDVATKIIWGPSQTLSIWVLDTNTGSEWKIRRDYQWLVMIKDKWDERVAHIAVEVVAKDEYERNDSSVASKVSNTGPKEEMTRINDGWMEMKAKPKAKVYHRVCSRRPNQLEK